MALLSNSPLQVGHCVRGVEVTDETTHETTLTKNEDAKDIPAEADSKPDTTENIDAAAKLDE